MGVVLTTDTVSIVFPEGGRVGGVGVVLTTDTVTVVLPEGGRVGVVGVVLSWCCRWQGGWGGYSTHY